MFPILHLKARLLLPALALSLATAAHVSNALGAQTEIVLSTGAAPTVPRIWGPRILGSRPGTPFLYTVPATGQAPLVYAVTELPSGLAIDASSGTISGTTPAAGSYPITVTVTNGLGSATTTLTLTAGPTLALTPPMGWNSYDSFGASVKESEVLAAAKAMKSILAPFGWNTVVIDYLWYDTEQKIDANGRWLPSASKYPSATGELGFKPLADQIHAMGLSFGIHLMRGIPRKSVTANSPVADSTYTASQAGDPSDTCSWDNHMYGVRADTDAGKAWYDSIYAQYASWGADFVKVDDMMNPYGGNVLHTAEVKAVAASLAKSGRSIILSLSPGPNQTKDVAVLNASANMWRTVNDFWDTSGLSNLTNEFDAAYNWSITEGVAPGHWPDADMLPLGYLGPRCPAHGSGTTALSHNQQVTVMTLWCIMPSPLMFGGNPSNLSGDDWTTALLTNEEVLAVNQDALGSRGKRISRSGTTEVWAKDLTGGRKAVALFNRGTQDATVSITFSQLAMAGTLSVRELWHRKDVTDMTDQISVNVPHEGAILYTLTPMGSSGGSPGGEAGASATGGTTQRASSTSGGTAGTGGAALQGGRSSYAGAAGSGRSLGGRAATVPSPSSGGAPSLGGQTNAGGATPTFGGSARSATGGMVSVTSATSAAPSGGRLGAGGAGGTQKSGLAYGGSTSAPQGGGDHRDSAAGASSGCSCAIRSIRGSAAPWTIAFGLALLVQRRRRAAQQNSQHS